MSIDVVVDGQYGSSGKGNVAGLLVDRLADAGQSYDFLVRVAGPNAGHTTYSREDAPCGRKAFALRTIPAACVRDLEATLYIAPGSEVDLQVLTDEIELLEHNGIPVRDRLLVDPQATVLTGKHKEMEERTSGFGRHGSTVKGIGAARAERAMRLAPIVADIESMMPCAVGTVSVQTWRSSMSMIEGTQGYQLGLHAGHYPHCTSSDCRAIDFLAMSGASLNQPVRVFVVFRTFPIRIAGNSGPLANETSWDALAAQYGEHIQPELTTVTKKVRRVGQWDPELVDPAMQANYVKSMPHAVLTFFDYLHPEVRGASQFTSDQLDEVAAMFGDYADRVSLVVTGPDTGVWL